MVPDEFHFAPIFHDPMFHWVGEFKESSILICLRSNEDLLVVFLGQNLLMFRMTNTEDEIQITNY